ATDALKPAKEALVPYVEGAFLRADDEIPPPPAVVRRFLEAHEAELCAVRRPIAVAGPIVWDWDAARLLEDRLPGLLGVIVLEKLFFAQAVLANAHGDAAEALSILDAMWRLGSSLDRRP